MKNKPSLSKINCVLYLDDSSLLVGCQTGNITTVDLSQGQVAREVRPLETLYGREEEDRGLQLGGT